MRRRLYIASSLVAWFPVIGFCQTPPQNPQTVPPIPPTTTQPAPSPQQPITQPLQTPTPTAPAGPVLTLQQAQQMARQRNGDVQAQRFNVGAADATMKQALGAFFPTITPEFNYSDERITGSSSRFGGGGGAGGTGSSRSGVVSSGSTTDIAAKWDILDSGQREYTYLGSRSLYQAEQLTFLQTLRQTIFTVDQQYFNTLRDEELESVAAAQSKRAATILDQTQVQVQVGASPQKDVLQARSDYLNSVVQQLTAKNQTASAQSNLKATIGWDSNSPLPALQNFPEPTNVQLTQTLDEAVAEGLRDRPDLRAARLSIQSRHYDYLNAVMQANLQWSLNAQYTATFSPNTFQDRLLNFSVSLPLFDGGVLREKARQLHFQEQAARATLTQRERDARAQIETDYITLTQNVQRVQAAKLAVDAARQNYTAEVEAQRLGAANATIVTVLTAQVTLVTAESNYIQAIYDYYISQAQLQLDTGQVMPGQ